MALERRLARLEVARGSNSGDMERDAEAFTVRLDKLAEAVKVKGDFADLPTLSQAGRYVRACLRGDDAMAAAILAKATGALREARRGRN
ncbi:MAG: hypothetical protein Q8Q26_11570 [Pseudorhodobacter sp.]|nr:hypothetical protein [Pseudorhodobacter sp.]